VPNGQDLTCDCAQATFVLAVISDRHPRGQRLVADLGMLPLIRAQLPHVAAIAAGRGPETHAAGLLAQWLALALGKMVEDAPDVGTCFPHPAPLDLWPSALATRGAETRSRTVWRLQLAEAAMVEDMPHVLEALLDAPNPELRASAAFALGSLLLAEQPVDADAAATAAPPHAEAGPQQREVVEWLVRSAGDGSPLVRSEAAVALARFASTHRSAFQVGGRKMIGSTRCLCHVLPVAGPSADSSVDQCTMADSICCLLPAAGRHLGDTTAVSSSAGPGSGRSDATTRPRQGRGHRRSCRGGIAQHHRIRCQRAVDPCGRQPVIRPLGIQQTHAGSRRRHAVLTSGPA
jgi:HEAT repeats